MSPHSKTVLRDLGILLHVPGIMALASLPVCWWFGETFAIGPLIITAAVAIIPGQVLYRVFRRAGAMQLRHAMVTVVLAWTLVPVIGLLPLLLTASTPDGLRLGLEYANFWDAFFESVSGFTSTGLTVSRTPSELPHILQWWRSFMQWIGGVGVVVLMLTVFHPATDTARLYFSEGHGRASREEVNQAVRRMWWIFALYTVIAVIALRVAGMDWWHAVNHGMTGIATGGFGTTDNSLADFGDTVRFAMMLVVLTGAVSFETHFLLLTAGRFSRLWKEPEHHALFLLLALFFVAVAAENWWYDASATWRDSLFQTVSALGTAGFSTVRIESWSPTALLLLSFAMMCGGVSGSTTGGLKLKRVVTLADGLYARIRGVARHPWRLMEHKPIADSDEEERRARMIEAAAVMSVLWVIAIVLGVLLLLHAVAPGTALDRVVFEVTSALGNVGLSSGISSPELHWSGKLGLIVLMWAGRLEIVPILVLVAALIVAPRRGRGQGDGGK